MVKISAGDKAPEFALPTDGDDIFSLSNNLEHPLVLFFYPKDDTPGCTREAVEFTEKLPKFQELGVKVAGISPDPATKHGKFRNKHGLKVTLISDEEKSVLEAYGVWVEKSMYGRKYMGVERTTLLINTDGTVASAWHKVKVAGHVEEVLNTAKELVG